jgi:hypothetical protein
MSVEWNGGGLPPIGLEVRVKRPGYNHPRFDRFLGKEVTVVAHDRIDGENVAVFRMKIDDFSEEFDYHALTSGCFEPLSTEAERKREEAVNALSEHFGHGAGLYNISGLYDKIAAGKIPHITLK